MMKNERIFTNARIFAWTGSLLLLATSFAFPGNAHASVSIENSYVRVEVDEESGRFSLHAADTGDVFVNGGEFRESDIVSVEVIAVRHRPFGPGEAIEVKYASESRDRLAIFPDEPFVLVDSWVGNPMDEPVVLNHVDQAAFDVELGPPPEEVITQGTGRLRKADDQSGSFGYLAVTDPETYNGVVTGWLSHDRGSGVLFSDIEEGNVRLNARLDHGQLRLGPGQVKRLDSLLIGYFDDARFGLESWADALAAYYEIALPPQPVGYCTWYSRPHGGAASEEAIAEFSEFAAEHLQPFGFDVIQIDDMWQLGDRRVGPAKDFTGHDPDGPYPNGMGPTAEGLSDRGFTPGLWLMPFAGDQENPLYADNLDWFVKTPEGEVYEDTRWGGTSLDMTHPGAREYTYGIVDRIVNDWGYDYLKLDGLWTGMATEIEYIQTDYSDDGIGDAVFNNPNTTNIQAYRSGLELVRQAAGRGTYLLGCNMAQNMRTFGASIGLVDAMRVGPDNGSSWDRLLRGIYSGNSFYFLHGRIWHNDPDPIYVREDMPDNHARLNISWVTISGQLNMVSEWLPGLPQDRLDMLKRTMPAHEATARPVDYFEHDPARIWALTDERPAGRRDVVALFNFGEEALAFDERASRLELPEADAYLAFDYWGDELLPEFGDRIQVSVDGESCRILSVRPVRDYPQLIGTSRHITQGIVDVIDERWEPSTSTLAGASRVVGGDPYELRITTSGDTWEVSDVAVSPADRDAGVTVALADTSEGLARVRIDAPENREVEWSVAFEE